MRKSKAKVKAKAKKSKGNKTKLKLKTKNATVKAKMKAKSKVKAKSKTKVKAKAKTKAKTKTKAKAKTKTKTKAKAKTKTKTKTKAKSKAKSKTKPRAKTKVKTKSTAKLETKGKSKAKTSANIQSKIKSKPQFPENDSQLNEMQKIELLSWIEKIVSLHKGQEGGLKSFTAIEDILNNYHQRYDESTEKFDAIVQFGVEMDPNTVHEHFFENVEGREKDVNDLYVLLANIAKGTMEFEEASEAMQLIYEDALMEMDRDIV